MSHSDSKVRFCTVLLSILLLTGALFILPVTVSGGFKYVPGMMNSHAPTVINGDVGFTSTDLVRYGYGTLAFPYYIENWSIECGSSVGIDISDTSKSFVIRNCYLANSSGGIIAIYLHRNTGTYSSDSVIDNCFFKNVDTCVYFYGSGVSQTPSIVIRNSTSVSCNYLVYTDYHAGSMKIENCDCINIQSSSIKLRDSQGTLTIRNITSTGTPTNNQIEIDGGAHLAGIETGYVKIDNVTIDGGGGGISITNSNTASTKGGSITNVRINNTGSIGLSIQMQDSYYIGNCSITNGTGTFAVNINSYTDLITLRNVTVKDCKYGMKFTNCNYLRAINCFVSGVYGTTEADPTGIQIFGATHSVIENCTLSGSRTGLYSFSGDHNLIVNNTIMNTNDSNQWKGTAINIQSGTLHTFINNTITNGACGIYITGTQYLCFHDNLINNSSTGIHLESNVQYDRFYRNFVINNGINAEDAGNPSSPNNFWNETYGNGDGNYWGNYAGSDTKNGIYPQSLLGADSIGDSPYVITVGSPGINDYYPLMNLPDNTPPNSTILPLQYWHKSSPFWVPFISFDNTLQREVGLMYSYSANNLTWGAWTFAIKNATTGTTARGNFSFTPPASDGQYRLRTNATDYAWNNETGADLPVAGDAIIGYDTTPPISNAYGLNKTSLASTIDIPYNYSDTLSGIKSVELWMSSSSNGVIWSTYTLYAKKNNPIFTNFSFSGTPGQFYQFYTRTNDSAVNYESAHTLNDTWTYIKGPDITAPHTTIIIKSPSFPSNPTNSTNVTTSTKFNLTATDVDSGVKFIWYSIDNGTTYKVYANEFTIQPWVTYILYGALDNDGNNETIPSIHRCNITVDTQVPWTTITIGYPNYGVNLKYVKSSTLFTLNSIDNHSGVASKWYRIDTGILTKYTAPFTVSSLGWHNLSFNASDNLGQNEALIKIQIYVDDVPSVTTITVGNPKNGTSPYYVNSTTLFNLTSNDGAGAGVKTLWYRLDLGSLAKYTGNFTVSISGSHKLYYNSTDNLNNPEPPKNISIFVDSNGPVSNLILGTPAYGSNPVYVKSITPFNISALDAHLPIKNIFYRVDSGLWVKYTSNFTISTAGMHTLQYYSTDAIGNAESPHTPVSIFVDDTEPVSTLAIGNPKHGTVPVYVNSTTEFNLTASDAGCGIMSIFYRIDLGSWITYTGNFTVSSIGPHNVSYRGADRLDNIEITHTVAIYIDKSAPVTSISVGSPKHGVSPVYVNTSTPFTMSASDGTGSGIAAVFYRISGGIWTPYTGKFYLSSNGSPSIDYYSVDEIGNIESMQTLVAVVDTTPPISLISVGSPKHVDTVVYVKSITQFNLTAYDSESGAFQIKYSIDNGSWMIYTNNFSVTSSGAHFISYNATDNLGNHETNQTIFIFVDDSAPVSTLSIGEPKYGTSPVYVTQTTEYILSAVDPGAGIDKIMYKIDSGSWKNYTGYFVIIIPGDHKIYYYSEDNLGNTEPDCVVNISVDNTNPSLTLIPGKPSYGIQPVFISGVTTITITSFDSGSGVASLIYNDGSGWKSYSTPFTIAQEGFHKIEYQASDNVGNTISKSLDVFVDNNAPVSVLHIGQPNVSAVSIVYIKGITKFAVTALDGASGVGSTWYRIDTGGLIHYTVPFSVPSAGTHKIYYNATDNVANPELARSVNIFVDDLPPVVSVIPVSDSSDTVHVEHNGNIVLSATDSGVGDFHIYYKLGSESAFSPYTSSIRIESTTNITFYAEDSLGNKASEKTIDIIVDEPSSLSTFIQDYWWALAVIPLVVLLLVIILFLRKRKDITTKKGGVKKEEEEEDDEETDTEMKSDSEKKEDGSIKEKEDLKDIQKKTDDIDQKLDKELSELEDLLDKGKIKAK